MDLEKMSINELCKLIVDASKMRDEKIKAEQTSLREDFFSILREIMKSDLEVYFEDDYERIYYPEDLYKWKMIIE